MNEIQYVGEHLWLGKLGHFAIILAFVSAGFSIYSYIKNTIAPTATDGKSWLKLGQYSFYIHTVSLFSLMGLLFFAMYSHMIEYSYVFEHVSADLPLKYILSAFWEGQEGSFMLWMFWHCVLGCILIRKSGEWQPYVMPVIALAEVILMTMILGVHIPWGEEAIKIGSNPTTLLRHMNQAPIFDNAQYLDLIKGRGLNPLLQNYWMTIHPPTLFLGFASTIVPFAYAIAGLWRNEHKQWLQPALGWALFSGGILGTGILMGSLWAYVALSFGGYWNWDPVENASLVPWITLIAGIHVHLVSKNTGYSTRSLYFFYLISFVLILYSTFLTRSGVLGDTSAHAFTEMGLEWQLTALILIFLIGSMALLLFRWKSITTPSKEEPSTSREYWMFMGSLILLFGATLITISTSLPLFNKIVTYFDPVYVGKVVQDPIEHYNKYQLWISVLIGLLSGCTLFLRYKAINWEEQKAKLTKKIGLHLAFSGLMTFATTLWITLFAWQHIVLCFSGFFAIISNLDYLISVSKGNIKIAYSTLSHLGFGVMIIGILSSGLNQKPISSNKFVFKGMFTDQDIEKYVQLIKNKPLYSQGYLITYQSDTLIGHERKYKIHFAKVDSALSVIDTMTLYPNAVYSNDFSKVAAFNPDTKHYLHKDIFTCVVELPAAVKDIDEAKRMEDSLQYKQVDIALLDTFQAKNYAIIPQSISYQATNPEFLKLNHELGLEVVSKVIDKSNDSTYTIRSTIGMDGALLYHYFGEVQDVGIRVKINDKQIDKYFTPDDSLGYKEYTIKVDDIITIGDYTLKIKNFDTDTTNLAFEKEKDDIIISANMEVNNGNHSYMAKPTYVIRNNIPFSIKHFDSQSGIHIRISNIDPKNDQFTFKIAQEPKKSDIVTLDIAEEVPRTDYLILQATIFPGINLFWAGSILMMVGLFIASWIRFKQKLLG